MASVKFTNIDPRDIPRSAANINIVASDLAISALKSAIAFRNSFEEQDEPDATSYLGTPVYDDFTFGNLGNRSENSFINLLGEQQTYNPIRIYQAILTVTRVKNIITSQIKGRNGTLKQYINAGDYSITMMGRVSGIYNQSTGEWTSGSKKFPKESVTLLKEVCDVNASLEVSSNFLGLFGITRAVITDQNFYQREGVRNEQMFEINMLSDTDTVLEFTEEDVNDNEFLKKVLNLPNNT